MYHALEARCEDNSKDEATYKGNLTRKQSAGSAISN